jgi:transcriptional regulator with PAS, ATPase and Fis domain
LKAVSTLTTFDDVESVGERPSQRIRRLAIGPVRHFGSIPTRALAMHEAFAALRRFAQTDVSVMLLGETGVGKEVLARTLHDQSPRARRPFVVFDCGAVAPSLVESELLGHERGAFTGALTSHAGAFERAHGGTLFLDEIGELPLDLQPRLLRALESRTVRRVGGRQERQVDIRVVAATHRDLRAAVSAGRFRQDLFFRLAVGVVTVPPLRDRFEDLSDLVRDFITASGRPDLRASEQALALLHGHTWPGNVRELKNVITYAVALLDPGEDVLEPHHLRLLGAGIDDAPWL